MNELKIELTNELDLTLLDNEFLVAMLNQIMLFKKCEVQYWDHGVCLAWYKYYCLSVTEHKRKLFIVKGKMYCFVATLDNKTKLLKEKKINHFRLSSLCRKTKK